MAFSHKLHALLITSGLPRRDFILTIPMWSSLLNCVQISETNANYAEGGNLTSQEQLTLASAQAPAVWSVTAKEMFCKLSGATFIAPLAQCW